MNRLTFTLASGLLGIGLCTASHAQNYLEEVSDYAQKVQARRTAALDASEAFGEQISYLDGGTRFSATDISIPGNNALKVELTRSRQIDERYFISGSRLFDFGSLYDWQLEAPFLEGTFTSHGWTMAAEGNPSRNARCSLQQAPYSAILGDFYIEKMWSGYNLHLPGQPARLMLKAAAAIPMPADGQTYPWAADGDIRIRCLPQLKNGAPGEGFLAVMPDGTRYYFDTMITRQMPNFRLRTYHTVPQYKVYLAASRVEDQQGNWVTYTYVNDNLTSIQSNDGRRIDLAYQNGRMVSATTAGRTWQYQYREPTSTTDGGLAAVILPDATRWSYDWVGSVRPAWMAPPQEGTTPCDTIIGEVTGPYAYTVTHPGGARATFSFAYKTIFRSTLDACYSPVQPNYYSVWSLTDRVVTGAGLGEMRTQLSITGGYPSTPLRWSTVTHPDGSTTRYGFGHTFLVDEGKIIERQTAGSDGVVLESTSSRYLSSPPAGAHYPARVGNSLHFMQYADGLVQPLAERLTVRESTQYRRASDGWDAFARPTLTTQSGPSGVMRERRQYLDNPARWILGAVASTHNEDSGQVVSAATYDDLLRPLEKFSFGLLQVSFTYNGDGTVATATDPTGRMTRLQQWKRGIPQHVINPDGTTRGATVDDNGWVGAARDENNLQTSYAYDSMGRLSMITLPADAGTAWNATSMTFSRLPTAELGIPAGHWKETEATGNRRKVTYYDALLRPVLEEEYDAADRAGTLSQTLRRYDHANRLIYESYPGRYR